MDESFNQKKINHIFHYTKSYDVLKKIIRNGFMPSYCFESFNNKEYFIPMVSFCNIPLKDVDNYMHYGKYGIGMSIDWAVREKITPVVYIHEKTPFGGIISDIADLNSSIYENEKYIIDILDKLNGEEKHPDDYEEIDERFKKIEEMMIQLLQYIKPWKTIFNLKEIITYHEREWRFIPPSGLHKKIINSDDIEFNDFKEKNRPKPHLPDLALNIESIEDIRYILIKHEEQRIEILTMLGKIFSEEKVVESVLSGKLLVLTNQQIVDDF